MSVYSSLLPLCIMKITADEYYIIPDIKGTVLPIEPPSVQKMLNIRFPATIFFV